MRVYDPAQGIVYVHLAPQLPRRTDPAEDLTPDRLPAGYANQSPRTRVRGDTGPAASAVAPRSITGAPAADVVPIRAGSGGGATSAPG